MGTYWPCTSFRRTAVCLESQAEGLWRPWFCVDRWHRPHKLQTVTMKRAVGCKSQMHSRMEPVGAFFRQWVRSGRRTRFGHCAGGVQVLYDFRALSMGNGTSSRVQIWSIANSGRMCAWTGGIPVIAVGFKEATPLESLPEADGGHLRKYLTGGRKRQRTLSQVAAWVTYHVGTIGLPKKCC